MSENSLIASAFTAMGKGEERVGSLPFWRKFIAYTSEIADTVTAFGLGNQYNSLTQVTPAPTDRVLVEDASDSFNKKYFEIGDLPSGGATAFTGLSDVPASYASQALKVVRVNAGETALEFVTLAGGGDMLAANNLSDLTNAGTARTNLGLGTIATQNADSLQGTFDFERLKVSEETSGFTMALSAGGDNYTADRILSIITGDADRVLTMTGSASISGTNTGDETGATINTKANGYMMARAFLRC